MEKFKESPSYFNEKIYSALIELRKKLINFADLHHENFLTNLIYDLNNLIDLTQKIMAAGLPYRHDYISKQLRKSQPDGPSAQHLEDAFVV